MFIKLREGPREAAGTIMVESERDRAAAGGCSSRGRRRAVLHGLRSDLRGNGSHTLESIRGDLHRRLSTSSREQSPGLVAEEPDAIHRRRRRYEQLRFSEERLRPLQKTKLAEVYWRVYAELHRVGREIAEEGLKVGGSRLDRE
ncbi:hypothetical protein V5E97_28220 [Singulisphaera sp. Ch08]|uniref:Uncharacterized protein n=1 Tax=Singulisphaera sp. Ch08 TaxID=3120278 RepID=A0AAU7CB55_9BACT